MVPPNGLIHRGAGALIAPTTLNAAAWQTGIDPIASGHVEYIVNANGQFVGIRICSHVDVFNAVDATHAFNVANADVFDQTEVKVQSASTAQADRVNTTPAINPGQLRRISACAKTFCRAVMVL